MKEKIQQKLQELSKEIENLNKERQMLSERDREVEIRMHQVVGAIYELQQLIGDQDHQPEALEKPDSL